MPRALALDAGDPEDVGPVERDRARRERGLDGEALGERVELLRRRAGERRGRDDAAARVEPHDRFVRDREPGTRPRSLSATFTPPGAAAASCSRGTRGAGSAADAGALASGCGALASIGGLGSDACALVAELAAGSPDDAALAPGLLPHAASATSAPTASQGRARIGAFAHDGSSGSSRGLASQKCGALETGVERNDRARMLRAALSPSLLLAAPLALSLSACTTYDVAEVKRPDAHAVAPDVAEVCVVRPHVMGALVPSVVRDNGVLVGATEGPSMFCWAALPGSHAIVIEGGDDVDRAFATSTHDAAALEATAGRRYWLHQPVGNLYGVSGLEWVDEETGADMASRCSYKALRRVPGTDALPTGAPVAAAPR